MKRFGRKDFLLIIILLGIIGVIWFGMNFFVKKEGSYVVVTVDGELYGRYALDESQEVAVTINGTTTNVLSIENMKADMIKADCPDQLCVHQRAIAKSKESIVCLPNKVVVTVEGSEESDIDSIAK